MQNLECKMQSDLKDGRDLTRRSAGAWVVGTGGFYKHVAPTALGRGNFAALEDLFAAIRFPPLANEFAESKCEKIIKNPCKIKVFFI